MSVASGAPWDFTGSASGSRCRTGGSGHTRSSAEPRSALFNGFGFGTRFVHVLSMRNLVRALVWYYLTRTESGVVGSVGDVLQVGLVWFGQLNQ